MLKDASSLARLSVPVIYFDVKVAMSGTSPLVVYISDKVLTLPNFPNPVKKDQIVFFFFLMLELDLRVKNILPTASSRSNLFF
jgi:hypothetical protein